jgi:hypothetical protein
MDNFDYIESDIDYAVESFQKKTLQNNPVYQRAVEQIKEHGICLESYDAIESVAPGTLSVINRDRLGQMPDKRLQFVALESVATEGALGTFAKTVGGAALSGVLAATLMAIIIRVGEAIGKVLGMKTQSEKREEYRKEMIRIQTDFPISKTWTVVTSEHIWKKHIKPKFDKDPEPWVELQNKFLVKYQVHHVVARNLIKMVDYDPKAALDIGTAVYSNTDDLDQRLLLTKNSEIQMQFMVGAYMYDKYVLDQMPQIMSIGKLIQPLINALKDLSKLAKDQKSALTDGVGEDNYNIRNTAEYKELDRAFSDIEEYSYMKRVDALMLDEGIEPRKSITVFPYTRNLDADCRHIGKYGKSQAVEMDMEKVNEALTRLGDANKALENEMKRIESDEAFSNLSQDLANEVSRRFGGCMKVTMAIVSYFNHSKVTYGKIMDTLQ